MHITNSLSFRNCIIDKNAKIGKNVVIANTDVSYYSTAFLYNREKELNLSLSFIIFLFLFGWEIGKRCAKKVALPYNDIVTPILCYLAYRMWKRQIDHLKGSTFDQELLWC